MIKHKKYCNEKNCCDEKFCIQHDRMWRCGQQHHSCVSAGSQCQSKCFELRLVTLCHSPHPLLSPDIQVPGLSVVCPNGIFYMYQLNWHVACMFQCVEVYVNIMLYIIFIVSIVIFFLSVFKYYSLHLSCEQFFCFISVFFVYTSGMNCTTRSWLQMIIMNRLALMWCRMHTV